MYFIMNCNLVGCSNSTYRLEKWYTQLCDVHGLQFGSCVCKPPFTLFPFPTERKDPEARKRWARLVNRKTQTGANWQPNHRSRICSLHFKDGEPTVAWPDPTVDLGYGHVPSKSRRDPPKERLPYSEVRKQRKRKRKAASTISSLEEAEHILIEDEEGSEMVREEGIIEENDKDCEPVVKKGTFLADHDYTSNTSSITESCEGCRDAKIQIAEMKAHVNNVNKKLRKQTMKSKCCVSYNVTNVVLKSDKTVKEYTGVESKEKLECLHRYLDPRVKKMRYWTGSKKESSPRASPRAKLERTPQKPGPQRSLSTLQEFVLVLMKLRLALNITFLEAYLGSHRVQCLRFLTLGSSFWQVNYVH